jgi:hypothetical protein
MANDRNFIPRRSIREKQTDHADEQNDVSKDDASKEVTTPAGAAVARPEAGLGFHFSPRNLVQQDCRSKMAPSAGRATPVGAAAIPQE